jgi:hypothetical protein
LRVFEIIRDAGFTPRPYSDRGMYGTQCIGFVPERHREHDDLTPFGAITMIINSVTDEVERYELTSLFMIGCAQARLGRDTILYFPDEQWDAESMEEDDDC